MNQKHILNAFYSLTIFFMVFGIIGNSITLIVLRRDGKLKEIIGLIYLSFISFTDTFSLFGWNFSLFHDNIYGGYVFNNPICNFVIFIQFFSLQSSGFLITFLCLDRYITVISKPGSFYSRLPFRTKKSALVWSLILIFTALTLNSHILFSKPKFIILIKNSTNVTEIEERFTCQPFHSTGLIILFPFGKLAINSPLFCTIPLLFH